MSLREKIPGPIINGTVKTRDFVVGLATFWLNFADNRGRLSSVIHAVLGALIGIGIALWHLT